MPPLLASRRSLKLPSATSPAAAATALRRRFFPRFGTSGLRNKPACESDHEAPLPLATALRETHRGRHVCACLSRRQLTSMEHQRLAGDAGGQRQSSKELLARFEDDLHGLQTPLSACDITLACAMPHLV